MLAKMLLASTSKNLVFVASAISSTTTIVVPATANIGDIAVWFNAASTVGTTAPVTVVPTGWTSISNNFLSSGSGSTTSMRGISAYKKLVSGDAGSTLTGMNPLGTTTKEITIIVFRPSTTVNTIAVGSINGQAINGIPTNQTLTLSGVKPPLIGFAHYQSTASPTYSVSGISMVNVPNGTLMDDKYAIYGSGSIPSNATISMTTGTGNVMQSFYLQFS